MCENFLRKKLFFLEIYLIQHNRIKHICQNIMVIKWSKFEVDLMKIVYTSNFTDALP